ncbi:MAG TPA: 3-deoxy-manno-octulosonate cytidylyltransferase [Xanthomonadales bacterium]|nr:3-deoxy-manno-octulosonate cytidylyltransferase [Xanthomonadales bacterium]
MNAQINAQASIPDYCIVIPARMASQRLPGKPLARLAGLSLIEHVYRCARESAASQIIIATDDEKIASHARDFGASVQLTSASHPSGSDRIAEVAAALQWPDGTIIVNLQGDEPLMPAACLDQVATLLHADHSAGMASLYWPISNAHEARDPNVVKVVLAQNGNALYFSRSLLPYPRDWIDTENGPRNGLEQALKSGVQWRRHVGLYAYRAGALKRFTATPATPLEQTEKLEQLRMLESGGRIVMAEACEFIPPGVDTPEDLARVENIISKQVK